MGEEQEDGEPGELPRAYDREAQGAAEETREGKQGEGEN